MRQKRACLKIVPSCCIRAALYDFAALTPVITGASG
jgi:hypothetical protein